MVGWVLILSAFISRVIDVYRLMKQIEIGKCIRQFFRFGAILYHTYVPNNNDLDSTNALYAIGPFALS